MIELNLQGVRDTLGKYSFPVDVIVEVTRYCNLACIMCPYPNLKRSKGHMSFDIFQKIVDEVSRENPETRVWLAIMGEPLMLGNELIEYISYAKAQGIKEVCLNTNGNLLNEEIALRLLKSGVDKILVSIDAFSQESYEKIRINGNFSQVYRNVERLLEMKRDLKVKKTEIITQFIVMEENENEVDFFKEFWLARGAVVKVRPKLGWGDAVTSSVLDKVYENTERFPCAWLTRTVSIHWDGSFSQCDADYEGLYSPGHLDKSTIKDVWENELKIRRKKHWEGDFDFQPCKNCKDWLAGRSVFYRPEDVEGKK